MNEADFKRQYLGDFKPDVRDIELHKKLERYYKDTPDDMPNRTSMKYWEEFKRWCSDRGCTQDEINRAKRDARI